jgi:peptide/nickel transport system permease protein
MKRSYFYRFIQHSPDIQLGLVIVCFFLLWAVSWESFLFLKYHFDYVPLIDLEKELLPPLSSSYLLGTDLYGRSLFEMISFGLIYSLGLSLTVSFLSISLGVVIGTYSMMGPKVVQVILEKCIHIFFTLPGILLAIALMSFFGQTKYVLIISLMLTNWASHARIVRGELKRILSLPYVEAAQALGASPIRLFTYHLFPFLLPQLSIHFILGLSGIIISESTLSFLGLTVNRYSWGYLLGMGKNVLLESPHITVVMSVVMIFFIIGLNLLGDGLRDYLDPQLGQRKIWGGKGCV